MIKFSKIEFAILTMIVAIIFISEYYYIVLKNHDRAIFIGLWLLPWWAYLFILI